MDWFRQPLHVLILFWPVKVLHLGVIACGFSFSGIMVIIKMFSQGRERFPGETWLEVSFFMTLLACVLFFIPERTFSAFSFSPLKKHLFGFGLSCILVLVPLLIVNKIEASHHKKNENRAKEEQTKLQEAKEDLRFYFSDEDERAVALALLRREVAVAETIKKGNLTVDFKEPSEDPDSTMQWTPFLVAMDLASTDEKGALLERDKQRLEFLLQQGANINMIRYYKQYTNSPEATEKEEAFKIALKKPRACGFVEFLLQNGFDPNHSAARVLNRLVSDQLTPVQSLDGCRPKLIELYFQKGGVIGDELKDLYLNFNYLGNSSEISATEETRGKEYLECARLLLKYGANPLSVYPHTGQTIIQSVESDLADPQEFRQVQSKALAQEFLALLKESQVNQ